MQVDEQNFPSLLEASMAAPVVLVVYSPSRLPVSAELADDLVTIAEELEGRIAVGRVDVDAQPAIAQAMQVQQVPLVAMVLQGRLAPLLQDAPPLEELRTIMGQVLEQMTAQGMTGRHQPFGGADRRPPSRARSRPPTRATPLPTTPSSPATSTRRWRSTRSSSTPTRPTPRRRSGSAGPG